MGMLLLSWDANVSLNQVQQPTTAGTRVFAACSGFKFVEICV